MTKSQKLYETAAILRRVCRELERVRLQPCLKDCDEALKSVLYDATNLVGTAAVAIGFKADDAKGKK